MHLFFLSYSNWDELRKTLKNVVDSVCEEFLQPTINNLKPKAD